MSTKPNQHVLNVAYDGPSIPPPNKESKSCNAFSWSCSCLYLCILWLITILVALGFLGSIFWVIFRRPETSEFHVNDATLTQFTLSTDNNTLYYNLTLNMTFCNPYDWKGIYYDRIEASAEYHGKRFDSKNLDTFYLGYKKEKNVGTVFRGQQVVVLGDGNRSKYNSERNDGVYNIGLKLRLRMRLKHRWEEWIYERRIECELKVRLSSRGSVSSARLEKTTCGYPYQSEIE